MPPQKPNHGAVDRSTMFVVLRRLSAALCAGSADRCRARSIGFGALHAAFSGGAQAEAVPGLVPPRCGPCGEGPYANPCPARVRATRSRTVMMCGCIFFSMRP